MIIGPVGLLLLVGAGLLIWWLAKQAPGWVVALLGGGLVLLVGFAALFSFTVRTDSRVVRDHERHGARQTVDEATGQPKGSAPVFQGANEKVDPARDAGSAAKVESPDDGSSTFKSKEEWPYRGRNVSDEPRRSSPTWDLAIGGLVLIVVVGIGLVAGFITLSIYLFKKNPVWIVLPVFGVLGLVVVLMGFVWLAKTGSSPNKYVLTAMSDEANASFPSSSAEDIIGILDVRYEVRAPASGGTVKELLVLDGAHVRKDETLLRLENKEIEESRKKKLAAIVETDKQLKDEDDTGKKTELEKTRSTQHAELDAIDERIAQLEIKSAIAGHIEAPKLSGMLNQIVKGGELILHVVETTESVEPDEISVAEAKPDPPVTQPPPPDWIHIPSRRVDGVDQRTVDIGPYPNPGEYEEELLEKIHAVISKYMRGILGVGHHPQFRVSERYIYDKIIKAEYIESRDFQLPVGRMKHKYVLLEFDNRTKQEIKEMHTMERRLGTAGFGSCLLLMLIGTVYGYLKLDTQTKGYYSGRLKLAATAAILTVVLFAAKLHAYYW